ncbi:MAG TPA: RrF2 family transcriptional regulator [Anaerolineae bacterium]|nr:RrF2 family transcriptional regulator [Anaerolineae bacterium]
MWISSKGEYGLRALFDLAQHYGRGPVQTRDIAQRQEIPESYLSQLLITLRKAGLITSQRGPHGGHTLSRPPTQIDLAEVVTVLEGTTAPVPCVEEGAKGKCTLWEQCVLRDVWREVKRATDGVLRNTTLDDLRQRHIRRQGRTMYYI